MPHKDKEKQRQYDLKWKSRHRDAINKTRKARIDRNKKSGVCMECTVKALPGRKRCEKHLQKNARTRILQAKKRMLAGRCRNCGIRLCADMDDGFVACIFCRERIPGGKKWRYSPESYRQITI